MEKRVFKVLFLSTFAVMLGVGIIAPLMPIYAKHLGATGIWLGIIFSGFSLSRAIFTPIIGKLSDLRGRKIFISLGLLGYTFFSLSYAWVSLVYELALIRFLHGFTSSMVLPIAMAYIGEISPRGKEGVYMGTFNISLFLGMGAGPLIGGALTHYFNISSAFYALGGLSALALALVLFFLPESNLPARRNNKSISFQKILENNLVKGIVIFRAINALGRGSIMAFLPLFAASVGVGSLQVGLLISVNIFLTALLQKPLGRIADKYNRVGLVIMGSIIGSLALFLIPHTGNFVELLETSLIMGLGGAISIPSATALVVGLGRDYGMGSVIGIFDTAMNLGLTGGPLIAGILMDLINLNSVFYFGGIAGIIGTILFYWFAS